MHHRPQACRPRRLRRVEAEARAGIAESDRGKILQKLVKRERIPGSFAVATPAQQGAFVAQRVVVEKDGVVPPM
jgi:hypothetical protein